MVKRSALVPGRRRETRLPGRRLVRPDDHLLSVLPLEGDHLVGHLEAVVGHLELTVHGARLELQDGVADLLAVERARAPDGLDQYLAAAVAARRVVGEVRARKLLPVRLDELL